MSRVNPLFPVGRPLAVRRCTMLPGPSFRSPGGPWESVPCLTGNGLLRRACGSPCNDGSRTSVFVGADVLIGPYVLIAERFRRRRAASPFWSDPKGAKRSPGVCSDGQVTSILIWMWPVHSRLPYPLWPSAIALSPLSRCARHLPLTRGAGPLTGGVGPVPRLRESLVRGLGANVPARGGL